MAVLQGVALAAKAGFSFPAHIASGRTE